MDSDLDILDIESAEEEASLDLEAIVKEARRTRTIEKDDVDAILAAVNEEQAQLFYERLKQLRIRIIMPDGSVETSYDESNSLIEKYSDSEGQTAYLGGRKENDPVHTYLKEIGQVPLLKQRQEVWLSTQLAAAVSAVRETADGFGDDGGAVHTGVDDVEYVWRATGRRLNPRPGPLCVK